MAKRSIGAVGCDLPGGVSEFIPFASKASLLDWDVVVFWPTIARYVSRSYEKYNGRPSLSDSDSVALREAAEHWRREMSEALRAGKTVFIFLPGREEVYVDTGERQHSGTGRNRRTTRIVADFNNYKVLPVDLTSM
ncbi:MAG: hypothetical protein HY271_19050 [Deltaproteobacteria bacterium]|nr:hypothetical protein [Deltaproteobacteria bacterium]